MTSKHGPYKRFKTEGNQTIQNLQKFNNPLILREHFSDPNNRIQAQVPKEFMWLYSNWVKTKDTPENKKWEKKMDNWTRAHPENAIDYLLETSSHVAKVMDMDIKDVLFFFIKDMKIEHLVHRPSFQHKMHEFIGRKNDG